MLANRKSFILDQINSVKKYCQISQNERLKGFPSTYKPREVQTLWYNIWEENKFFIHEYSEKKAFTMILPPPNVTGTLHLGHALTVTIQDVLNRWHIMKGHPVLWIPGFDHAGIATQAVVEKYLYKTKNIKKADINNQELFDIIYKWKEEKSFTMGKQLKKLGASLNWDKEYFTLSKQHNEAVNHAFVTLNNRNLIYRKKALINWSPTLGSAISDIEVEFETIYEKTDVEVPGYNKKITFGQLYYIQYDIIDSAEVIPIATTRPETIPGDVALAVHPDDERYKHLIGKRAKNPITESHLPIISDENVKIDFGTGVVKITPAHDQFDYTIADKHNLEFIEVIDESGKLTKAAGRFENLPRYEAREKILNFLSEKRALFDTQNHEMNIPRCSRTGDIIELLLKEQWFMNCKNMALRAVQAVENGSLKIDPEFHKDKWVDWLTDIRDWCISRQLIWGHQIPAYFYEIDGQKKWIIAQDKKEASVLAEKLYGQISLQQDPDVLDTWFSSALLPFTTLDWPKETDNFQINYPLSMMESGHDIIFFWIARMVMLGIELTGKLPFKEILLHGLLCDSHNQKMSKSRGNIIFPENVIDGISLDQLNLQTKSSFEAGILSQKELKRTLSMNLKNFPNGIPECGVDALRFSLCSHNIKERTVSFNIVECEQNKFFFNKIWQASKYVLLHTEGQSMEMPTSLTLMDQWILSRLCWMVQTVNEAFEDRQFYKGLKAIKQFTYFEFCDYYVEGTKLGFRSENFDVINSHRYTLVKCLEVILRTIAPITPYLSDDLYSKLSKKLKAFTFEKSLLQKSYPAEELRNYRDMRLEEEMKEVLQIILSIRGLLGSTVKKSQLKVDIVTNENEDYKVLNHSLNMIKSASKIECINIFSNNSYKPSANSIFHNVELKYTVHLLIDDYEVIETVKQNLRRKKAKSQEKLDDLMRRISNKKYLETRSEDSKMKDEQKISILRKNIDSIPHYMEGKN